MQTDDCFLLLSVMFSVQISWNKGSEFSPATLVSNYSSGATALMLLISHMTANIKRCFIELLFVHVVTWFGGMALFHFTEIIIHYCFSIYTLESSAVLTASNTCPSSNSAMVHVSLQQGKSPCRCMIMNIPITFCMTKHSDTTKNQLATTFVVSTASSLAIAQVKAQGWFITKNSIVAKNKGF